MGKKLFSNGKKGENKKEQGFTITKNFGGNLGKKRVSKPKKKGI